MPKSYYQSRVALKEKSKEGQIKYSKLESVKSSLVADTISKMDTSRDGSAKRSHSALGGKARSKMNKFN